MKHYVSEKGNFKKGKILKETEKADVTVVLLTLSHKITFHHC